MPFDSRRGAPLYSVFVCGCLKMSVCEELQTAATEDADARWMRVAIDAARTAAREHDEVPVGACIVSGAGELLAVAGNRTRTNCDPTAHAEVVALRAAAQKAGNYRLTGAVAYSTIEPCAMCAGALVQARVARLVYGARDERAGAVESVFRICDASALNHRMELTPGVLEADCKELMQTFFRARRKAGMRDEG
jgi:tRNA(adenine34) deaminase